MTLLRTGVLGALFLLGLNAFAEAPPRTYDEMKESVVVQRFPGGRVLASSAAFPAVEESTRYSNGGKVTDSVSVLVEAWPDKPVVISLIVSSVFPLFPTEVSGVEKPDPNKPLEAHVGLPWTETSGFELEGDVSCPSSGQWCRWSRTYRIDLSQDFVRQIVASEKQGKITIGLGRLTMADWTIPRDHLIATLDAIGLLHAFR